MSLLRLLSHAQAFLLPSELNINHSNSDYPGAPDGLPLSTQVAQTAQSPSGATPLSDERPPVSNPPLTVPSPAAHQVIRLGPSAMISEHARKSALQSNGFFTSAHDFIIQDTSMTVNNGIPIDEWKSAEEERRAREESWAERQRQAEEERREGEILQKLIEKGMPSAMPDADEYAPKTDPGTRTTLREKIVKWGGDPEEIQRLLWLSGPAGVGKSAVARSVAEELAEKGLLGAAFFFSRTKYRSDPGVVIPTLVFQLAQLLPEYKRLVVQRLAKNPSILDSTRRSQFKELITGPFKELTSENWATVRQSLVIVLDGLDECRNRSAQVEFVDIICSYARTESSSRLRWMICSRPEPELNVAFPKKECKAICHELKLDVHNSEARSDTEIILNNGFDKIRERYLEQLSQDWPTEDQVTLIAERASGHHGFASFIVRFIGDREYNNPSRRLNFCLEFLKRTAGLAGTNPLHSLDLLYTQLLLDTPEDIFPTTRRILGLLIFYGDHSHPTTAALANFLDLDRPTFYSALQRLYSVLIIPRPHEAGTSCLQVYHASFSDFLTQPARSGKFCLDESVVLYLDIVASGLKWLSHARKHDSDRELPKLTWTPPDTDPHTVLASLCRFAFTRCWKACLQVPKDSVPKLLEILEKFDFRLDYEYWWTDQMYEFAYFIRWLTSLESSTNHARLVRVKQSETGSHEQKGERQTTIYHSAEIPRDFVAPFLGSVPQAKQYRICFELGKNNGTSHFCLVIKSSGHHEFYEGQERVLGKLAKADKARAKAKAEAARAEKATKIAEAVEAARGPLELDLDLDL
ncbi:hypothetical protein D9756_006318 [Leucocoprinus leucothites]|uniref:NACHT domain-containing protein n=1 Tax=Leucocoprinus leucothites TaxID=201217 RepID=A0A8H5D2Y1_9AGAR|nr:hypothetical protein D9756_006318 [Leucoagaricus leucothites]